MTEKSHKLLPGRPNHGYEEARRAKPHAEIVTMLREAEHHIHEVLATHFQRAMDEDRLRTDDPYFLAETSRR
ncbi:MAG: hypothetical protein ACE3K2_10495 [Paenibacillus sp.]|uniref:hypothetical protein n=1 Tax=Paenibacillus sp. TaxID=58172 RepID=UPI003B8068EA